MLCGQRFFQDVTSPGWLAALREWGVFAEPPNRQVLDDGSWYASPWVAGVYLPRVVAAEPDVVTGHSRNHSRDKHEPGGVEGSSWMPP